MTIVLADCAGPYGLVHVNGTLVVEYAVRGDAVHVAADSSDLTVNGASLDVHAQADWSVDGSAQTLAVTTSGGASGPRGGSLSRQGSYTVSWDEAALCMTLEGSWSTT